jgi:hypothetical protein
MNRSVLASKITKVLELPGDAGLSVTIRALNNRMLGEAMQAAQAAAVRSFRDLGGSALVKELQTLSGETIATARAKDPLTTVDLDLVLEKGVVGWNLDEEFEREKVHDFEPATAELIGREIMRLTRPDMFLPAEEAQKND